jgi:TonB family protein
MYFQSTIIIILLSAASVKAQSDTVSLDIKGNVTNRRSQTVYKRVYTPAGKYISCADYMIDGSLQMKGKLQASDSMRVGTFEYYNREGKVISTIKYKNDKKEGVSVVYYPGGQVQKESNYHEGFVTDTVKHYYPSGKLMAIENNLSSPEEIRNIILKDTEATNALLFQSHTDTLPPEYKMKAINAIPEGKATYYYEDGTVASEELYSKGKLIYAHFYNEQGKKIKTETEQNKLIQQSEMRDARFLAHNLQYPQDAREDGIQGKVYIEILLDKDGKIQHAVLLNNVFSSLNQEALRVVMASKDQWTPAKWHNLSIPSKYTLPISFRLQ